MKVHKEEYVHSLKVICSLGGRGGSQGIRRTLLHLNSRIIWSTAVLNGSSLLFLILFYVEKIWVPNFHMFLGPSFPIVLVSPIYWTKKSTSWQIIFGFVVINPTVPSHFTCICKELMTPKIYTPFFTTFSSSWCSIVQGVEFLVAFIIQLLPF